MDALLQLDPVMGPAIPLFIVFWALELIVLRLQRRELYPAADGVASVSQGLLSMPFDAALKAVGLVAFSALYRHRLFELTRLGAFAWPLLVLGDDLSYYWHHRACHSVRLLWAGHIGHHSSQEYNFTVALRQGVGERLHKLVWYLWLPLLGFPPLMVLTMMSASLVFQYFLHTETVKRLGVLEWVLNTPSHHRVHHGSNVRYLDQNYGGILVIWDRLFGTFTAEDETEPVVYGLTKNIETRNVIAIATHEYVAIWRAVRSAPTWSAKLGYILRPPGWSHDGSTETAKVLRARLTQPSQPLAAA